MTLVLFIPYNNGYLLIADRQNTFPDGLKTETKKLHLQSENGPAIGGAGYTDIIQSLYSELKQTDLTTCRNICKQVQETVTHIIAKVYENAKLTGATLRVEDFSPEMFVAAKDNPGIALFHFNGSIYAKIDDLSVIMALPAENQRMVDYSGRNTCNLSEQKAILLGKEILTQMAFSDNTIGPPQYHGFDLIEITKEGEFSEIFENPILEKRDASQVFDYVNRTEEEE